MPRTNSSKRLGRGRVSKHEDKLRKPTEKKQVRKRGQRQKLKNCEVVLLIFSLGCQQHLPDITRGTDEAWLAYFSLHCPVWVAAKLSHTQVGSHWSRTVSCVCFSKWHLFSGTGSRTGCDATENPALVARLLGSSNSLFFFPVFKRKIYLTSFTQYNTSKWKSQYKERFKSKPQNFIQTTRPNS